jgi:signal transduction histidine kinase
MDRVRASRVGAPARGLQITIRNRLPIEPAADPSLPGGGMGLTGLTERVTLSGGSLSHGPSARRS